MEPLTDRERRWWTVALILGAIVGGLIGLATAEWAIVPVFP